MNHLFSHELNYEIPGGSAQGKMCRITPPSPVKGNSMESLGEERTFIQDFQVGFLIWSIYPITYHSSKRHHQNYVTLTPLLIYNINYVLHIEGDNS